MVEVEMSVGVGEKMENRTETAYRELMQQE